MASPVKFLGIAALVLILLVAGGLFYLSSNLNGIVATLIEEQGSVATQTSVRVDGVDIQIAEASASLSGLKVANPQGFTGNALELGGFSIALDAASLTSDTIVVKDITVAGARVNVQQNGAQNNLRQLLSNLQGEGSEEPAPSDDGPTKKLIIERFTLEGASASVDLADLKETREVELPPLVLTGIGRESNGATAAQVAEQVLKPLLEAAITSATADTIKDRVGEQVGGAVGGLLKGLNKKKDET